jgi:hypothetical protein
MNPTFLNWLRETLQRLLLKSPKFFKIWSWFWGAVMFISGIPYLLTQFGVVLPEPFASLSNKVAATAGLIGLFMSSMTVKTAPVAQTEEGKAITVLPTGKLPFTEKSEAQEVEATKPPPPVIPTEEIPNRE